MMDVQITRLIQDRKKFLITLLLLFTVFVIAGLYLPQVTRPKGFGDSSVYLDMAKNVWTFTESPWGYRVAIPYSAAYLAYYLHLPLETMFQMLQVGIYAATVTALFAWLHFILQIRVFPAVLGLLLFVFSYPGLYNLHNTIHVGYAEHLLLVLGCIAIYQDAFLTLAILTAISSFVKETIGLLIIPTYLAANLGSRNWIRLIRNTLILLLIFAGLSFLLRTGILFRNNASLLDYVSFYNKEYIAYVMGYWGGFLKAGELILYTFGPVWVLAVAGLFYAPTRLKAMVILPIAAIFQILLGTDLFRMVGIGFPVVLALCAVYLERLDDRWASMITGVSLFYYLSWNHDIASEIALWGSVVLTVLLLVVYGYRSHLARWFPVQAPSRGDEP